MFQCQQSAGKAEDQIAVHQEWDYIRKYMVISYQMFKKNLGIANHNLWQLIASSKTNNTVKRKKTVDF